MYKIFILVKSEQKHFLDLFINLLTYLFIYLFLCVFFLKQIFFSYFSFLSLLPSPSLPDNPFFPFFSSPEWPDPTTFPSDASPPTKLRSWPCEAGSKTAPSGVIYSCAPCESRDLGCSCTVAWPRRCCVVLP